MPRKTERHPFAWLIGSKQYTSGQLIAKLELEEFSAGTPAKRLPDGSEWEIRYASKRRFGRLSMRIYPKEMAIVKKCTIINREQH